MPKKKGRCGLSAGGHISERSGSVLVRMCLVCMEISSPESRSRMVSVQAEQAMMALKL